MKLTDYIQKHYDGNKRQFALDNKKPAQWVTPMIKRGNYHVIDGNLAQFTVKLKIHEADN